MPHYVLDFEETFRREVVTRFVDDYSRGSTPNPCVSCNTFVKLGTLRTFADRLGARYVATGHYAKVEHGAGGPRLFAGDPDKDQSYALAQLTPAQLEGLLLPLGDLRKTETRAEAARLGLPVRDKPESQDICFVEGGDYRDVLRDAGLRAEPAGAFVTTSGSAVGTHEGISHYTVGQRRGLPAMPTNDGPRYVTRIDPATNTIVIGREDELLADALLAGEVNLIRPELFGEALEVRAMTRYRAPFNRAVARYDATAGTLRLDFASPERAVAPGQLVALYALDRDEVLGAGTIIESRT